MPFYHSMTPLRGSCGDESLDDDASVTRSLEWDRGCSLLIKDYFIKIKTEIIAKMLMFFAECEQFGQRRIIML